MSTPSPKRKKPSERIKDIMYPENRPCYEKILFPEVSVIDAIIQFLDEQAEKHGGKA